MPDPILTKTIAGVSKEWMRKEIDDIKAMLDQLPLAQTNEQYVGALEYCEKRIEAMKRLATRY